MKQMKRGQSVWLWIFSLVLLGVGTSNCGFWDASPPSPYPPSWTAHEYEVLELYADRKYAINRNRLRAKIFAPMAITPEDRAATVMEAALHFSKATRSDWTRGPDWTSVTLWSTPSVHPTPRHHFLIATVEYAPDGCGVSGSGDDCTGLFWTNLEAMDGQLTKEQLEIWEAWDTYKADFTERIEVEEYSYDQIDEDRLREFLAKKFGTTPDHILDQSLEALRLTSLKEIDLPSHE